MQHGLHPLADAWAEHCRRFCESLSVPCRAVRVDIGDTAGIGLEAAARQVRYRSLSRLIEADDVLLTAHHLDDQAETVLLQLMRGAGVAGLSAMPLVSRFAGGWHLRPLLGYRRTQLLDYARAAGLKWIEDSSNLDTRLGRNFLRHRVLPLLETRWPAAGEMLARSAWHAAEAAAQLSETAAGDLLRCRHADGCVELGRLAMISPARQRNVLREWIRRHDQPAPSVSALEKLLEQTRARPSTGHARLRIGPYSVCRYGDRLYVVAPPTGETAGERNWLPSETLELPNGYRLRAIEILGSGLSRHRLQDARLTVDWRHGGERCRLAGQPHSRPLKKILQEAGVPPWERRYLPLIRVNGELAAIGDRWICEPFTARAHEAGWLLRIEPSRPQAR